MILQPDVVADAVFFLCVLGVSGPEHVVPILGGIVEMVKDPFGFWERQRLYATSGLSYNSLVRCNKSALSFEVHAVLSPYPPGKPACVCVLWVHTHHSCASAAICVCACLPVSPGMCECDFISPVCTSIFISLLLGCGLFRHAFLLDQHSYAVPPCQLSIGHSLTTLCILLACCSRLVSSPSLSQTRRCHVMCSTTTALTHCSSTSTPAPRM